jgi:putative redox protein
VTAIAPKHVSARRTSGFVHSVSVRGHRFVVDEPEHLGGSDTAASPLELLAAALATCTASTVEVYAERKGWQLGAVEVDVIFTPPDGDAAGHFDLILRLPAELEPARVERLETVARKCPVRRTLDGAVVVERLEATL